MLYSRAIFPFNLLSIWCQNIQTETLKAIFTRGENKNKNKTYDIHALPNLQANAFQNC